MIKVTLDTTCFFDYFEREPRYIQELIDLETQGKLELACTTRVQADTLDRTQESKIWDKIKTLPVVNIGSVFRWGNSRWVVATIGQERTIKRKKNCSERLCLVQITTT